MLVRSDALNIRGAFRPLSVMDVMEFDFSNAEHDTAGRTEFSFPFQLKLPENTANSIPAPILTYSWEMFWNYAHSWAVVAIVNLQPKGPIKLNDDQKHLVDAVDLFVHARPPTPSSPISATATHPIKSAFGKPRGSVTTRLTLDRSSFLQNQTAKVTLHVANQAHKPIKSIALIHASNIYFNPANTPTAYKPPWGAAGSLPQDKMLSRCHSTKIWVSKNPIEPFSKPASETPIQIRDVALDVLDNGQYKGKWGKTVKKSALQAAWKFAFAATPDEDAPEIDEWKQSMETSANAPNAPPEYGHEGEGEEGYGESEGEGEGETLPSAPAAAAAVPGAPGGVPGVESEDEYEFVPKETAGGGTWETDAHVWEIEVPMRSLLPTTTAKDAWMFECVNAFFVQVKFSWLDARWIRRHGHAALLDGRC
eukprot:GABV01008542.1.p1 GENE.GABV01008542.1~~GABV01008542.1.p1  ORF type:complete len:422 (+),score=170.84 GABV01008542.1:204-1469(+)